jgi:hypothetical protein
MRDASAGGDSPVGAIASPRIHRSSLMASTPERDELSRQLEYDFLRTRDRELRKLRRPCKKSPGSPKKRRLKRRVVD